MLPGQIHGTLTPPTDLPISPSNSSTHVSSDKCLRTPHHVSVSSPLAIPTLSASPPQADESDEHIAKLLDDMLMDLNILPLMPIDKNLDEQDQLGPLLDPKGQQRAAEASAQGVCLYMQSCEPEMKGSDVRKTAGSDGSPGQRDEGKASSWNDLGLCAFDHACVHSSCCGASSFLSYVFSISLTFIKHPTFSAQCSSRAYLTQTVCDMLTLVFGSMKNKSVHDKENIEIKSVLIHNCQDLRSGLWFHVGFYNI